MAKTRRKKAAPKAEPKKEEKERFLSWFMSKVTAKKLKAYQHDEVKEYFRAIKLDTNEESKGKYDKAFERF